MEGVVRRESYPAARGEMGKKSVVNVLEAESGAPKKFCHKFAINGFEHE